MDERLTNVMSPEQEHTGGAKVSYISSYPEQQAYLLHTCMVGAAMVLHAMHAWMIAV
jgi:hypothetical protein